MRSVAFAALAALDAGAAWAGDSVLAEFRSGVNLGDVIEQKIGNGILVSDGVVRHPITRGFALHLDFRTRRW